ncbi:ankyrin repeat domain-containing protein [Marilutibacter chinensis]|uniref:Ankyrin repeat domain-containing protein n=1 Tax=Marilutibacter chinensis TaxID=2912247 RepID=A0ABS9HSJ4_9GAMM|nr:ankyrin repeat domain-containing protein [Lysobacter chinensis]MCF7221648.1 ankyrin repeat domain-containing protein [Lysobacter chinensis]
MQRPGKAAVTAAVATRPDRWLWIGAATGVLLSLLAALGGVVAALAGVLAQPAFAVAVRRWRAGTGSGAPDWRGDGLPLLLAWGGAGVALAALLAWPLSALVVEGTLSAALGVSAVIGLVLIALWRTWPAWQRIERDGGSVAAAWRGLPEVEPGAWRGVAAAAAVLLPLLLVLLLAWPELLAGGWRWAVGVALALVSPAMHLLLQGLREADPVLLIGGLPVRGMATDVATEPEVPQTGSELPAEALVPALYAAARSGRVERALELIEAGADPHAPPPPGERDRRSLAALASVLPDLRLLRQLIAAGVDLNAAHGGMTPLIAATRDSWHGRPDAVMTLLANGSDPRARDGDGNTPLHHAARSSDPGVAALLRDAAADIDALNGEGQSPLGVACACGNWRLARFLLERGARPHPADGRPALLAAAGGEDDDPAGVQLLLKQKARVDAADARGRTALHEAVLAGHEEIIAVLLAAGADPAIADVQGHNAVLEAARAGRLAVLERLLQHLPRDGAEEANALDASGRNALQLACMAEATTPALIERLLALGVSPEHGDGEGKRAVDRAAEAGRWALVAALDAGYAMPACINDDTDGDADAPLPDRPPAALLRDALAEGRERGAESVARLMSVAELGRMLHIAPIPTATQVEWLLRHGADAGVRNPAGDTVLFDWLDRGPAAWPQVETLLRHGHAPSGAGGLARCLAACVTDKAAAAHGETLALDLLERGADPFAPSPAGDPSLTLAVRLGWSRLLDRLLTCGVDLNVRDSHGMSALHLAAALGREDMLRRLVAHGAVPDLLAADGQTPLGVALSSGRRDLADWLDWRGWPLPRRRLRDSDVPAAAIVGDADAVRRLLDLGHPVDAADSQGCTALLRASGGGHSALVGLLLARGADPRKAANSGATPLSAAVSMRHADIVDALIAAGAPLEQRLPGELTVLMVACALGLPDMAARLLAAGADAHAVDAQGRTPLHCAAMFGFTARDRTRLVALFDTLLLADGDADVSAAGVTPLLLLLGARAEPGTAADEDCLIAGMELLVDHDAHLDVADPRGFGPLHLAALHGLVGVVQWLLRAGADPEQRDSLNRTPREIAVMRGFVDIAAEFGAPASSSGVSMARFLRDKS